VVGVVAIEQPDGLVEQLGGALGILRQARPAREKSRREGRLEVASAAAGTRLAPERERGSDVSVLIEELVALIEQSCASGRLGWTELLRAAVSGQGEQ